MTELALAPTDRPAAGAEVAAVADNFVALTRTFNRTRAKVLAAAAHDVEWSAHVLLKSLANGGSMRAGALAECLQSDPSTVSRQVAALVRNGLLERRPDPEDGRASLLVLTDRAREVLAEHDQIRLRYFEQMLAGWSPDDLRTFADLLLRFTDDYDNSNTEWIFEHLTHGATANGGTEA